jgi:hypothetical protein
MFLFVGGVAAIDGAIGRMVATNSICNDEVFWGGLATGSEEKQGYEGVIQSGLRFIYMGDSFRFPQKVPY